MLDIEIQSWVKLFLIRMFDWDVERWMPNGRLQKICYDVPDWLEYGRNGRFLFDDIVVDFYCQNILEGMVTRYKIDIRDTIDITFNNKFRVEIIISKNESLNHFPRGLDHNLEITQCIIHTGDLRLLRDLLNLQIMRL